MITPPAPGTAVKDEAPSMVRRIYCRWSIAWECNGTGLRAAMNPAYTISNVLCNIKFRRADSVTAIMPWYARQNITRHVRAQPAGPREDRTADHRVLRHS